MILKDIKKIVLSPTGIKLLTATGVIKLKEVGSPIVIDGVIPFEIRTNKRTHFAYASPAHFDEKLVWKFKAGKTFIHGKIKEPVICIHHLPCQFNCAACDVCKTNATFYINKKVNDLIKTYRISGEVI